MNSRKLDRASWRTVLDAISKEAQAKRAEVEVAGLGLGGQLETDFLPLIGVVYDPKDDLVEIALEGVDHLVRTPREVHVVDAPAGVSSIIVVDADDNRHIVKLRDPLLLAAPADTQR